MPERNPPSQWIDAAQFDLADTPIYSQPGGEFFKSAQYMSRVRYEPGHYNPSAPAAMHGEGELTVTWVYGEEPNKHEGLLCSGIELVMDSHLAAGASIGLHKHTTTEEIYYLLEGELTVTLIDGNTQRLQTLYPGDAHRIALGQSHFIQAGADGARFIVVAATALLE